MLQRQAHVPSKLARKSSLCTNEIMNKESEPLDSFSCFSGALSDVNNDRTTGFGYSTEENSPMKGTLVNKAAIVCITHMSYNLRGA